jgi:hypothetical protein
MVPINMKTDNPYKMPSRTVDIIAAASSGMPVPVEAMAKLL